MGGAYSKDTRKITNRMPIISPRHVPKTIDFKDTPYAKFDPVLYEEKFKYPAKEPPKYW